MSVSNQSVYTREANSKGMPPPIQNYHTSSYYPYPEPNKTFRLNPLVLGSLKTVDIDDLQQIFGKGIQDKRDYDTAKQIETKKIFDEDLEIKTIKDAIEHAKLNQTRCLQIQENLFLKMQNLVKDTEADDQILRNLIEERKREKEEEEKKQKDRLLAKKMIQEQMLEKRKLKEEEGKKEYERDKLATLNIMEKIREEDKIKKEEDERKKAIARSYMENAYAEKEERKLKEKEDEEIEKLQARKYYANIAKREADEQAKKNAIQNEKDKIFDQLAAAAAKKQAENEYWENVRNELYIEKENRKAKIKEMEEAAKRQKQKEDMLASAIQQMKYKQQKKKEEEEEEEKFKKKLLEQFKNEEKLELDNIEKRKQKEKEFYDEVERLWKLKLAQYHAQKQQVLKELEDQKKEEERKRILIEKEKERLIRENEALLKKYYAKGYNDIIQLLHPVNGDPNFKKSGYEPIYNNIFGNINPNPASAYPKYGKIKNFVYDINIQDIQKNLNMDNYPMYNATLNNDYDSYCSENDYRNMALKNKMPYMTYAGGPPYKERSFVKGAPRMPKEMEKITIPYLENEYKNKLSLKKNGMKTPLSDKFYQPQIIYANDNQYMNQIQRNKTINNFFPSTVRNDSNLNIQNRPTILPQNIHRDISMPQINQNQIKNNTQNIINNNIVNQGNNILPSRTTYGTFGLQNQIPKTQNYQYQKLDKDTFYKTGNTFFGQSNFTNVNNNNIGVQGNNQNIYVRQPELA